MSSDHHQSFTVERVCRELQTLHQTVSRNWGRIEIVGEGQGTDDSCVLMSKAELAYLERALEIYNQSDGGKKMSDDITRIAAGLNPNAPAPAMITLPADTLSSNSNSAPA